MADGQEGKSMQATRVDISGRLEIVSRRLDFLGEEHERIRKEQELFAEEKEALERLKKVYAKTAVDPIDVERSAIRCSATHEKHCAAKRGVVQKAILASIGAGSASIMELMHATGLSAKQVANGCHALCKAGKIARVSHGRYRIANNLKA